MEEKQKQLLKQLPAVDRLLENRAIQDLLQLYPRILVTEVIQDTIDRMRKAILSGNGEPPPAEETVVERILHRCAGELHLSLRRAINGVGIVLHTGLGRAAFAEQAIQALMETTAHFCTLQADIGTGKRGDRYAHVEGLLKRLSGAEAAMVVNNNAAATMLILNTLAEGKEVIVSRGELVEIGGSFRIPDVMRRSGARLVEVGASNRTHLRDYTAAVGADTAMLLKVHQSNFKIIGFTSDVAIGEIAELAHEHGLYAVDDLGSGALVDLAKWGLPQEPVVSRSIAAGADVVCFSGDKLLGGPQCGIIVGKKEPIERMKKNQLTRALRCGKMTYTVLEATLRLFLEEEKLLEHHPTIRMLTETPGEIKKRAQSLKRNLASLGNEKLNLQVLEDLSEVGSGSLAGLQLPTWVVSLEIRGQSAETLAADLRLQQPPVFTRIKDGHCLIDCRTVRRDEFVMIREAVRGVLG
ncbi:L-seryl-tRNA(Sec) selenium transferase [bacterium]|nr:L-seryl-tRNA(Sec) selenium transferase [bacterium]